MDEFYIFPGPCQPIRIENYIPVYDSEQYDIYGSPENWGISSFLVIQTQESARPMVTDYKMEMERRGALRPIHHYSRVERFKNVLYQLLGCRGIVPKHVIEHIQSVGYDLDPDHIWDSIRNILKRKQWRLYYNRIPIIIQILGYKRKIDFGDSNEFLEKVITDFKIINTNYELLKGTFGRTYFPSLRFVAFKLIKKHGAEFQYKFPYIRTPRKIDLLEGIWTLLV